MTILPNQNGHRHGYSSAERSGTLLTRLVNIIPWLSVSPLFFWNVEKDLKKIDARLLSQDDISKLLTIAPNISSTLAAPAMLVAPRNDANFEFTDSTIGFLNHAVLKRARTFHNLTTAYPLGGKIMRGVLGVLEFNRGNLRMPFRVAVGEDDSRLVDHNNALALLRALHMSQKGILSSRGGAGRSTGFNPSTGVSSYMNSLKQFWTEKQHTKLVALLHNRAALSTANGQVIVKPLDLSEQCTKNHDHTSIKPTYVIRKPSQDLAMADLGSLGGQERFWCSLSPDSCTAQSLENVLKAYYKHRVAPLFDRIPESCDARLQMALTNLPALERVQKFNEELMTDTHFELKGNKSGDELNRVPPSHPAVKKFAEILYAMENVPLTDVVTNRQHWNTFKKAYKDRYAAVVGDISNLMLSASLNDPLKTLQLTTLCGNVMNQVKEIMYYGPTSIDRICYYFALAVIKSTISERAAKLKRIWEIRVNSASGVTEQMEMLISLMLAVHDYEPLVESLAYACKINVAISDVNHGLRAAAIPYQKRPFAWIAVESDPSRGGLKIYPVVFLGSDKIALQSQSRKAREEISPEDMSRMAEVTFDVPALTKYGFTRPR